jgi:hypothetical protein
MPSNNKPAPVEDVQDVSLLLQSVYGVDDRFELEVSGKGKSIELPDGRAIDISPGVHATLRNLDTGESTTVVATGTFHTETLPDGSLVVVATGRNLLFDPEFDGGGLFYTTGRFTFGFDQQGDLVPLSGTGEAVHLIDLLV